MKNIPNLCPGEIASISDAWRGELLQLEHVGQGVIKIRHANVALIIPPHLVARPLPSTLKTGDCFRIAGVPFVVRDSFPDGSINAVGTAGVTTRFAPNELASATVLI